MSISISTISLTLSTYVSSLSLADFIYDQAAKSHHLKLLLKNLQEIVYQISLKSSHGVLALGATAGALILGLLTVARGGDPVRSNTLMKARVGLQALALMILLIVVVVARG